MTRVHTPRKRKANPPRRRGIETVDWKDATLLRTFRCDCREEGVSGCPAAVS